MKKPPKDFLLRIKPEKLLSKWAQSLFARRKQIVACLCVVFFLALGIFLLEYYGFGHWFRVGKNSDAEVRIMQNADLETHGFTVGSANTLVAESPGAFIVVPTDGGYVKNIKIDLGDPVDYGVSVQYTDPKTGQELVLKKNLQKSMEKKGGNLDFLKFLVFRIENAPEKITITSSRAGSVLSGISIDNQYHFNFYRFIFVFFIGVLCALLVKLRGVVGKRPEYAFFAVAMVCGTLICLSELPEYVSWDEATHYRIADNALFSDFVSSPVVDIYAKVYSVPASNSFQEQDNINAYFDSVRPESHRGGKSFTFSFSLLDFYHRLGHLPSSFALMLGRIIHLPNHVIFMFGRWMNILVYSAVVFLAISKLKSGKMLMSVIALLPTVVFLASNYGYDYWVTSFTLLGFAYLFSELQQPEKKISRKNMAIMIGAFVAGLGPKAIYFPLMFAVFLLKKEKFASLREYKYFIAVSAASILLVIGSFMLPFVIDGPGKGDTRGGSEVNSTQQVGFILHEPLAYSKILVNFMRDYIDPRNGQGFVSSFAYLGTIEGFWLVLATLAVVALTDKNSYDKEATGLRAKFLVTLIYFATVALISTALYIAFTAVRSVTIAGVQPRYLIPLLFPWLFVVGSSRIRNPINRGVYNLAIFAIMASVLLWGIWDLIIKLHY